MDTPLSVLLRDGTHSGASSHLALKVNQVSISVAKSPIQVPVPRGTPLLLDLGIAKPTITISGIIDTIGQDPANTGGDFDADETWGMEKIAISDGTTSKDYVIPYKNYLEDKLITWGTSDSTDLQVEIGDATRPVATNGSNLATGGSIYKVAVTQIQFTQAPALEDRWTFTIQFLAKLREGVSF